MSTPAARPWSFDVATAHHDDVKHGRTITRWSRVTISATAHPDWRVAAQVAGCLAVTIHGGMPTAILPRY
jgi:hypothetical protein